MMPDTGRTEPMRLAQMTTMRYQRYPAVIMALLIVLTTATAGCTCGYDKHRPNVLHVGS